MSWIVQQYGKKVRTPAACKICLLVGALAFGFGATSEGQSITQHGQRGEQTDE
jgi:hypothetical protein